MYKVNQNGDSDEIVKLLRETTDSLGNLLTAHVKLARLEVLASAKTLGQRLAMLVAIVAFLSFGYALSCLGLVVVTSRWMGLGYTLFLFGGAHLAVGAAAFLFIVRKPRGGPRNV